MKPCEHEVKELIATTDDGEWKSTKHVCLNCGRITYKSMRRAKT